METWDGTARHVTWEGAGCVTFAWAETVSSVGVSIEVDLCTAPSLMVRQFVIKTVCPEHGVGPFTEYGVSTCLIQHPGEGHDSVRLILNNPSPAECLLPRRGRLHKPRQPATEGILGRILPSSVPLIWKTNDGIASDHKAITPHFRDA